MEIIDIKNQEKKYIDYDVLSSKNSQKTISNRTGISSIENNPFFIRELIYENEEELLKNSIFETITILSFFATSLHGKHSLETVFWDVVENCISQLGLEDCVIYHIEDQILVQKAAYGNKCMRSKKILSPIKIPMGKGIVGSVAQSGQYELVKDTLNDKRYIIDDLERRSELAVPIFLNQKIIGVLDSEHSSPNFFNENYLFLFRLISRLIEKKLLQLQLKKTTPLKSDNIYYKKLHALMHDKKIYKNPDLTLNSVASLLEISSNYVSQMINKLSGCNFSDYINNYRIEDVKLKLKNKSFSHYTILSIGLEAGFNSKSTFYSAFKKHTGISPTEFRQQA